MDAQEITFNQDPEAAATDMGAEDQNSSCCCNIICCPCRLFYWYIAPLTCELCHTIKCFLFHPINFGFAIFLLTFDLTMIGTGIGIIPLCCMGIPLLWITFELVIAFSRLDLGFNYYMAGSKKSINKSKQHLLSLSVYYTNIPLCCCYNHDYENCMNLMFERMKSLFSNGQIYQYILFQTLIRPLITFGTWWICIVVAVNFALCGLPIWYQINDTMFVRNQVILGYAHDCKWISVDGYSSDSISCDHDYIWIINNFDRALLVGVVCLLILPLTMRLNNWFAHLNKVVAIQFYTFYYTNDLQKVQDKAPILSNTIRVNSV